MNFNCVSHESFVSRSIGKFIVELGSLPLIIRLHILKFSDHQLSGLHDAVHSPVFAGLLNHWRGARARSLI